MFGGRSSRHGKSGRGRHAGAAAQSARLGQASQPAQVARTARSSRHARPTQSSQPTSAAPTSTASSTLWTPTPFAEATDITDLVTNQRRLRRNLIIMRVITALLLIAAVCVAGFPVALQYQSSQRLAQTSNNAQNQVANWPYPKAEEALKAARAYNKRLAASGQPVLGEAIDPFAAAAGGSKASDEDSASSKDKEYQSLLDSGNGVMGTIRIPKVSIDLPIYHGTSEKALASGAGHLYGSSLPVGGESTHSVITGHRGLVEAMMFTRLDEMKEGDFFYIEVMGETLGYKVDRITVIEPNDTSQLKIVPGEDRVTLMTCTPYGVNTHRLLVSGHRVAIPVPAPDPSDLHDGRTAGIVTGVTILAVGWFAVALLRRLRRMPWRSMHHAGEWPHRW
ncbi:sortase [Bifidobacterium tissieri]|uniref:Sortase n=1 Tax=Bifidobacterium tissieri TaxID=1630162 RepID=A0A261FHV8_9BIFI|nr:MULTISPECIES: class C sortase [Bifidobacterium]OZG58648.1 sortase [Bifidobacterium tissieri]TPF97801.1 sortase [Bifidobacterium sp. UTCIF-39]